MILRVSLTLEHIPKDEENIEHYVINFLTLINETFWDYT